MLAHTIDDLLLESNPHAPSYDARYILRYVCLTLLFLTIAKINASYSPETVESLFIAFRLTGNPYYREVGWKIFEAIQKFCRVETGGYASILNVDHEGTTQMDKMETFFLVRAVFLLMVLAYTDGFTLTLQGETLKYLYLLFSDDTVIPLDSTSTMKNYHRISLTIFVNRICLQYGGTSYPYLHAYSEIWLPLRTVAVYQCISITRCQRMTATFMTCFGQGLYVLKM